VQHETLGIYEQMPLLALDLLARVVAVRVNRRPPFSALLTLWLLCRGTSRQAFLFIWCRPVPCQGSRFSSWSARWAATAWGQRTRWNNLSSVLTAENAAEPAHPERRTHLAHRPRRGPRCRSRSVNRQAVAGFALQRNSVFSIHMRCRMTASLRATATVAFDKPRRCAIRTPQAFRLDHRCVCVSSVCAAS
jgi:hypothetical protein